MRVRPRLFAPGITPAEALSRPSKGRWTRSRKRELCFSVHSGTVTLAAALAAHAITFDEFATWFAEYSARRAALDDGGIAARQR